MQPRMEEYRASVQLVVDAQPIGDKDILGVPVAIPVTKGDLTITLSETATGHRTAIEIQWVFQDWFMDEAGQDWKETSWELWERIGALYIPNQNGEVDFSHGLAVGEVLVRTCSNFIARLALVSRSPYFWSRVRQTDLHELQGEVAVDVAGHHVRLRPQAWSMILDVRPAPVSVARAQALGRAAFPSYANFLLTADRRFLEGDFADAVVHLAQGVEVAAYAYVRTKIGPPAQSWHFEVHKFFGPSSLQHAEIAAINPGPVMRYPAICELFGARHEWVHEGRRNVRPFDPSTNRCSKDTSKFRDLTRNDYYEFRSAASGVLVWMGEEPIE